MEEEVQAGFGLLGPAEKEFAHRWDKRKSADDCDFDWVGEDCNGIWLCVHPEAAFYTDEQLWGVVNEWRMTSDRRTFVGNNKGRSHWWITAWLTMYSAQSRKEASAYDRGDDASFN